MAPMRWPGLIVMRSHDPEDDSAFATEASLGDYDSCSLGAMVTAPGRIARLGLARRSAAAIVSDGFRTTASLGATTPTIAMS